MPVPIHRVDAFTNTPFRGNPAAVCLVPGMVGERWIRAVAVEMNLPATAFVEPEGDGYSIRWLTPTMEISLCGHGALAAAHVLITDARRSTTSVRFHTLYRGSFDARLEDDWIWLDLPTDPATPIETPAGLSDALGLQPAAVSRSKHDLVVELDAPTAVESAAPDFKALGQFEARAIVVTAPGDAPYDIVSRVFEPSMGINEDHATGSVHCVLADYWARRLGRDALLARQASPRGADLRLELQGDRVRLGGQAVTVARGSILAEHDEPPLVES